MLICGDSNMFQKSSDKRTKGRMNFYKARKEIPIAIKVYW